MTLQERTEAIKALNETIQTVKGYPFAQDTVAAANRALLLLIEGMPPATFTIKGKDLMGMLSKK
jgi:hypothetical protein